MVTAARTSTVLGTGPVALVAVASLLALCSLPVSQAAHSLYAPTDECTKPGFLNTPSTTINSRFRIGTAPAATATTTSRPYAKAEIHTATATTWASPKTGSFTKTSLTYSTSAIRAPISSIGSSTKLSIRSSSGPWAVLSSHQSSRKPAKSESNTPWKGQGMEDGEAVHTGVGTDVEITVGVGLGDATEPREERRRNENSEILGAFGKELNRRSSSRSVNGANADRPALTGALTNANPTLDPVLACPSTLSDLTGGFRSRGGVLAVSKNSSQQLTGTRYPMVAGRYIDFVKTITRTGSPSPMQSAMEGTFQKPIVSWFYERGWRQRFRVLGFPGIDAEFRQAEAFFLATGSEGGVVLDLSCGSGLMMRRLVASNKYSRVIGGDLSPSMLRETALRFGSTGLGTPELIRCDASNLPLKTESVDGIHAGAALHCWTRLEDSLSEVYRVLKPRKGFFATTFLRSSRLGTHRRKEGLKLFEMDELERLMLNAGFAKVEVVKNGLGCAIVRATKGTQEVDSLHLGQRNSTTLDNERNGL